ncbi:MAG TPA: HAD hydrolase-like protein [Candidatus Saccharimonadales bacterium]|nr:HAD hydrolase-like protein [Candidatus Saccharimonadales bacterium]
MATLLFDFDGTLADTFFISVDIFRMLNRRAHSRRATDDHEVEVLRGLPARQAMKRAGLHFWQVPYVLYEGRKIMRQRIGEVQAFSGIAKLLKQLHNEGYTLLVVSTNSPENVQTFLERHKLTQLFDHVYADIGLFSKARAFGKIMHARGITADQCIYIGDEVRDLDATKKAGMRCISVSWGYNNRQALMNAQAPTIVDTPQQLYAAVRAMLRP